MSVPSRSDRPWSRRRLVRWGVGTFAIAVVGVIGVAWTATYLSFPDRATRFKLQAVAYEDAALPQRYPPVLSTQLCDEYHASGFAWETVLADSDLQPVSADGFVVLGVRRAGWPWRAFSGEWRAENGVVSHRSALMWATSPTPGYSWCFIPMRPLWRGLVLDIGVAWIALVAAILGTRLTFHTLVRRRLRLERGLCPQCAYPMGDSKQCTECGGPLP